MQFSSIPEVSATGGAEVADAVETVVPKENINQIQAPTPSTPLQQQQKLQNNEAKDNVNVSTPYETASPTSTSSPTIRKVESNSLGRKRLPSANDATILPQQQLHELTKALSRSRLSSSLNDLKSIIASGSPTISSHNSIANLSSMENGAQYLAEHSNSSSSIVAARVGHIIPHRFSLVYLPTISKCRVCTHGFKLTSRHLVCDGKKQKQKTNAERQRK